jgi:hypothetical protein
MLVGLIVGLFICLSACRIAYSSNRNSSTAAPSFEMATFIRQTVPGPLGRIHGSSSRDNVDKQLADSQTSRGEVTYMMANISSTRQGHTALPSSVI